MLRKAIFREYRGELGNVKGQTLLKCLNGECRHTITMHTPHCNAGRDKELQGIFRQVPCKCKEFKYTKER